MGKSSPTRTTTPPASRRRASSTCSANWPPARPCPRRRRILREQLVIYEAHVKGLTRLHPEVPEHLRGNYAGLASAPMLAHYKTAGHHHAVPAARAAAHGREAPARPGPGQLLGLQHAGLLHPRPALRRPMRPTGRPCATSSARWCGELHRNGIEVVLDVVYNHTAEGGAGGPTLSWRGLDNACQLRAGSRRATTSTSPAAATRSTWASRAWCSS